MPRFLCGIILLIFIHTSCKKKEEYTIPNGGIIADVVVDSQCAASLGLANDTIYSLYVSNTFSHNEDGNNDEFAPVLIGTWQSYHFEIRNRYNQKIFETNDPELGWHSYYADSNVYQYSIRIKTACSAEEKCYTGSLQIIR